jgi:hypothetical protein
MIEDLLWWTAALKAARATAPTTMPSSSSAFAALKKSLRSKRGTGYRVGPITEEDKYGSDPA